MLSFVASALITVSIGASGDPLPGFAGESLLFIENVGQWSGETAYVGRLGGTTVFVHDDGFTIRASERVTNGDGSGFQGTVLRHVFEGATEQPMVTSEEPTAARIHVLKGARPEAWVTGLVGFRGVRAQGLYPGIDLVLRGDHRSFEYDLEARPGADLSQVQMRIDGADAIRVSEDGALLVDTVFGTLRHAPPTTIQLRADGSRETVDSRYVLLRGGQVGFEARNWDPNATLLIDPTITWSTYLGGALDDHDCGVMITDNCNCYVTGDTLSLDFPTTPGAFDVTQSGDIDAFVANIVGDGSALWWSTYLGGTKDDYGHGVITDASGAVYVAGGTGSLDFPATAGAHDTSFNGGHDLYIAKLTADGSSLHYATYIGGAGEEGTLGGQAIALTPLGEPAVAGYSFSVDFPVTKNAPDITQNDNGLDQDAVVVILKSDGSGVAFASYFGGVGPDLASCIDIDPTTNVVAIGGWTRSPAFPVTVGAFATTPNAADNGFVLKLDAARNVAFASYIGSTSEIVRDVASDPSGAVLAAGYTPSASLPTTPGVFQPNHGGLHDSFVARFASDGTSVGYISYLGGSSEEAANAIDTDGTTGDAYVCGLTQSTDFPTSVQAFDATYNGNGDAFVSRISADGTSLVYSTYLGGSGSDVAYANEAHDVGSLYVSGGTRSTDFPVTNLTVDGTPNGGEDVFVSLLPAGVVSCPGLASASSYGAGKAGQNGVPVLVNQNAPSVPQPSLTISVTNGAPNAPAFLLFGGQAINVPFDGGALLVAPLWVFPMGLLDGNGETDFVYAVNDNPNYCGATVMLQTIIVDPTVQTFYGTSQTNGLTLTFGN